MPIYEYQCKSCGYEFESIQKISESPLKDCPECTKPELQKLVSAAGFRLKGSGWYETDFKHKGSKKNLAESKTDTKAGTKTSDTKSDGVKTPKKSAAGSKD